MEYKIGYRDGEEKYILSVFTKDMVISDMAVYRRMIGVTRWPLHETIRMYWLLDGVDIYMLFESLYEDKCPARLTIPALQKSPKDTRKNRAKSTLQSVRRYRNASQIT